MNGLFPQEDTPYFAAVGRLIINYASAENAVHMTARRLSGLDDGAARILFAGMRLADLSERIRGLLRLGKATDEQKAEITECLDHLAVIAEERNRIVHRSTGYMDKALVVTNALIAKGPASYETHIFTLIQLQNMELDCSVAFWRLIRAAVVKKDDPPDVVEFLMQPWRYKPGRPENKNRPRHKARQSRKRPPRSSPA